MTPNKDKAITPEIVKRVAELSKLDPNEKEMDLFGEQLARILDHIAQLDEVDTTDTEPTSHAIRSMKNVFRADEPRPSLTPEEALATSPDKKGNFFRVPKIIKEK